MSKDEREQKGGMKEVTERSNGRKNKMSGRKIKEVMVKSNTGVKDKTKER